MILEREKVEERESDSDFGMRREGGYEFNVGELYGCGPLGAYWKEKKLGCIYMLYVISYMLFLSISALYKNQIIQISFKLFYFYAWQHVWMHLTIVLCTMPISCVFSCL